MTKTKSFRALALLLAVLMFASLLTMGMNAKADWIGDLFDNREESSVVLKEGVAITYNKDASVMKAQIVANMIDYEASILPEGTTADDFTVKYAYTAITALADSLNISQSTLNAALSAAGMGSVGDLGIPVDVLGFNLQTPLTHTTLMSLPALQAGPDQHIYVTYNGNDQYKPSDAEGTLTVNKANVKVSIKSGSIYPDEALAANFVTTDPEDDFTIWTMFAGINTSAEAAIYILPPQNKVMDAAFDVLKLAGVDIRGRLQEGMTIGEFREMMNQVVDVIQRVSDNPVSKMALDAAGINIDTINALVDALQNFTLFDNTRIAFGTPNKSGLYTVAAIATNKNYNPGIGVGVLLVKLRIIGVSLEWNDSATTVSAAEAASHDFGAVTWYDGQAYPNQSVKYSFIGIKSAGGLYAGMEAPTEPGTYLQTAFNLGGNFFALPQIRSITITE